MTGDKVRVQFDVTSPSEVALFRHVVAALDRRGHETVVTARDSGATTDALEAAGIDHRVVSKARSSRLLAGPAKLLHEVRVAMVARSFAPDVVVSGPNPAAVHAAHLVDAASVVFACDERRVDRVAGLVQPFATAIHTPTAFGVDVGTDHGRFSGCRALGALHPDRFEPDGTRLRAAGIDPDEPFTVLGLSPTSGGPGQSGDGFSERAHRELYSAFGDDGDVYVVGREDTAVDPLPLPATDRHHAIAFADCYVGDVPQWGLEAGVLGTPAVQYVPGATDGVPEHLDAVAAEYGIVVPTAEEGAAVRAGKGLLADPDASDRWLARRERYVHEHADTPAFVLDRIFEACDRGGVDTAVPTGTPRTP